MIKIIESPRDGMQGLKEFIPTHKKAAYINALLRAGFHIVDAGSFVSPKAVPQMRDTAELIEQLDLSSTSSALMVLIINKRGAETAAVFDQIKYLGFPFSISPQFLQKNINKSMDETEQILNDLREFCDKHKKALLVYVSMAFGNPYGDPWNMEILEECILRLKEKGQEIINLSDTTGEADAEKIREIYSVLIPRYPELEFGLHLHTNPADATAKVEAALQAGCLRFDTVLNGMGGCPMTGYELLGNLDTMQLLTILDKYKYKSSVNYPELEIARKLAQELVASSH